MVNGMEKDVSVELLRVIACLIVIGVHAEGFAFEVLYTLVIVCLVFGISFLAALFLQKTVNFINHTLEFMNEIFNGINTNI